MFDYDDAFARLVAQSKGTAMLDMTHRKLPPSSQSSVPLSPGDFRSRRKTLPLAIKMNPRYAKRTPHFLDAFAVSVLKGVYREVVFW